MLLARKSCCSHQPLHPRCSGSFKNEERRNDDDSFFEENFCDLCLEGQHCSRTPWREQSNPPQYPTTETSATETIDNDELGQVVSFSSSPPTSPSCVSEPHEKSLPLEWKTKSFPPALPLSSISSSSSPPPHHPENLKNRTYDKINNTTPLLVSCLRNGSSKGYKILAATNKRRQRQRRVRFGSGGEWNPKCKCLFSHFHDDVLMDILSHLDMEELIVASQVCRRWKYCSMHDHTWTNVDATSFVQTHGEKSPRRTSDELIRYLNKYSHNMKSLTIRSIEHRLLPDIALPTLSSPSSTTMLCELTLTSYAALTDIHVHSMLLSSKMSSGYDVSNTTATAASNFSKASRRTNGTTNRLRKLVLEQCPLLTNGVVRSIALLCSSSHLEELSLRGNRNITSIIQLKDLWNVVSPANVANQQQQKQQEQQKNFASSLFSHSHRSSANALEALFMSPPPPQLSSLSSLFPSPPSSSPYSNSSCLSSKSSTDILNVRNNRGKLRRLDVSRTGVTPHGVVEALRSTCGGSLVRIESLHVNGEGWSDDTFERFTTSIHVESLQDLDIGCTTNLFAGSKTLTSVGLRSLFCTPSKNSPTLKSLIHLNLSGHKCITSKCVADLLYAAPNLVDLNLSCCTGISSKMMDDCSNDVTTSNKIDPLALALMKFGKPVKENGNDDGTRSNGRGLERLLLRRCFKNRQQTLAFASTNSFLTDQETVYGRELLQALCSGPSSKTLKELDLDGCYFITKDNVDRLLEHCPWLIEGTNTNLNGTKYSDHKKQ